MTQSPYPRSDRDLLTRIGRSAGSKAGYKQLVRELGLGGGRERRLLLEQLTRMVARGELQKLEDELWTIPRPPAASANQAGAERTAGTRSHLPSEQRIRGGRERLLSGKLEMHRDGFGFVRPEGVRGGAAQSVPQDIFIPPPALHGAMHGDIVLVDVDEPDRNGRLSGRIARVLTRRHPTVVGIFHFAAPRGRRRHRSYEEREEIQGNFVRPLDERMGGPIEIPEGAEVVSAGTSPHRTIGSEARSGGRPQPESPDIEEASVQAETPDSRWPLEGLAVEVEITSFAQPGRPARGRLVEVLGDPDAFGVDVEIIIRKHGIPHTFPTHVLAEADEQAKQTVDALPEAEFTQREDFRGLPIVTIDGETARDFDDAVLVRPLENGHTELQVHIADVGWYVQAGSALDTEARVRGTSVYFPDRAVPMLPHALSSGMCSLLPNEDRLVLSCVMEIDGRGEIVGYRVAEGLIRSARRMTYTSVQSCLNASPHAHTWNQDATITPEATAEDQVERERIGLEQPELPAAFDRMLALALQLNRKRVRRGSIDFDLPEPVVRFDPDGNMMAIVRSERGWSHRLIEEFMLSANECVATWLTAQGISSIYRIHEMPDPKRVLDFEETAASFGQTLGVGALPTKRLTMKADRRDMQRRNARGGQNGHGRGAPKPHDIPERIPVTPQMYQRLVSRIAGEPEERILAYLMLRSLKQARYAEKNEGHFALASPCYTHFTSPIRRYPDLIVHRLLRTMLRRGAEGSGGPVLSTDPQPWATEVARAQGRHAAHLSPAPRRAELRAHLPEPTPPKPERKERSARQGRIGWSAEPSGWSTDTPTPVVQAAEPENPHEQPLRGEPISAEELADMALESSQSERRASDAERELIEWKKMKFMTDKVGEDFTGMILSVTKFGFFVELDEMFIEGLVPLGSLQGDFYSFRDADRTICGARSGHCFRVGDRVEVILDRIDRQEHRLQFALLPGTEPKAGEGGRSRKADRSETEQKAKAKPKAKKTKGKRRRS